MTNSADDSDSPIDNRSSEEENDDSSSEEIDEEEGNQRKSFIMNNLTDLEKQFFELREQLYEARRDRVISKLEEVKSGKAPEYLQPLEDLQDQMRIRTEVAGILKNLRLKIVRCQFEAENVAVKQNFEMHKQMIINNVRSDINEKLRRLDVDKISLDQVEPRIEYHFSTRDHLFLPDRRRKPISITGPFIIYMLKEQEILEDYAAIKKASLEKIY